MTLGRDLVCTGDEYPSWVRTIVGHKRRSEDGTEIRELKVFNLNLDHTQGVSKDFKRRRNRSEQQ